ncbi:MAG: SusC/RagA family TonB-linked outer membrane protein, partial [Prolixibacteraceae bacterium]|nr:SusC/RagA family TonB-linked outer membrane protein [Prolixibacteraceae bacterium]
MHLTILKFTLLGFLLSGVFAKGFSNGPGHSEGQQASVPLSLQDQRHAIGGKVTDQSGNALPGVTIVVKGSTNGTITDIDGAYLLNNVPDGATLVYSFVGMLTRELKVEGNAALNVVLRENAIGIDEVVAIGYGSMRKSDLTGSVVTVKADDLNSVALPSISNALQGKAAGVHIVSSGTPGSDATIRIRGTGTINNNNPLLVIDGFPTDGGLNQLNMNDIESIQVLKDASATAIYGSRGANGVVIITTKKGNANKSAVNVDYYYGIQQATNMPAMLDAEGFASLHNEMMEQAGLAKNPAFAEPASLGAGTNWVSEMIAPAVMQNLSLSYTGGNDRSTYYVSGNVFDQQGIVLNTGFKRYTIQFNAESKVFDWLKFGNNLTLNNDIKTSGSYSIRNILMALPTLPVYEADGSYAGPVQRPSWDGDIRNPVGAATLIESSTKGYNLRGAIY